MNLRRLLIVMSIGVLASCGGSGSGSGPATDSAIPLNSPVSGQDLVRGTITGFGSVFIDGKRFATDDATFTVDGEAGTQDDLKVGMVVNLTGDSDDGAVVGVFYDEDVKGPVDSPPVVSANGVDMELVVMGQTVIVKPDTIVDDNLDLDTVFVGDVLEVSGYRGANDVIEAAFIEAKDPGEVNKYKVIGYVRNLDEEARTFEIGGLTVNYNDALLDDLPGGLSNDLLVEVKDENTSYAAGMLDPILDATKVEGASFLGDDGGDDIGEVQIEALITEVIDASTFRINGRDIHHDDMNTVFLFGDVTLLEVGVKIQVKGTLSDDGSVQAFQIKFKRNVARIEASVDLLVDDDTVIVFGVTVDVGSDAKVEDARDDDEMFDVGDLLPMDFVEVRGLFADGRLLASELERDDGDDDTRIRGVATDIRLDDEADTITMTILGIGVFSAENTQYQLDDESGSSVSVNDFFDALIENQTVVQATWDGNVADASGAVKEFQIED